MLNLRPAIQEVYEKLVGWIMKYKVKKKRKEKKEVYLNFFSHWLMVQNDIDWHGQPAAETQGEAVDPWMWKIFNALYALLDLIVVWCTMTHNISPSRKWWVIDYFLIFFHKGRILIYARLIPLWWCRARSKNTSHHSQQESTS